MAVTYQGEDLTTISAACAHVGTDAGLLVGVKARGLLRIGEGRLPSGQPLIRRVVYNGASVGTRTAQALI